MRVLFLVGNGNGGINGKPRRGGLRAELQEYMDASWERNKEAYRYLAQSEAEDRANVTPPKDEAAGRSLLPREIAVDAEWYGRLLHIATRISERWQPSGVCHVSGISEDIRTLAKVVKEGNEVFYVTLEPDDSAADRQCDRDLKEANERAEAAGHEIVRMLDALGHRDNTIRELRGQIARQAATIKGRDAHIAKLHNDVSRYAEAIGEYRAELAACEEKNVLQERLLDEFRRVTRELVMSSSVNCVWPSFKAEWSAIPSRTLGKLERLVTGEPNPAGEPIELTEDDVIAPDFEPSEPSKPDEVNAIGYPQICAEQSETIRQLETELRQAREARDSYRNGRDDLNQHNERLKADLAEQRNLADHWHKHHNLEVKRADNFKAELSEVRAERDNLRCRNVALARAADFARNVVKAWPDDDVSHEDFSEIVDDLEEALDAIPD